VSPIVDRLQPADSPYRFEAIIADDPAINAVAVPGGWIVVNQGLLRRTRSPEEQAGVLAHEMQHILQRHTTNGILRQLSWRRWR
jgi:predicted Zn-dependent protease